MRRDILIAFRVTEGERKVISAMAEKLQRKEADAVRFVVNHVAQEIVGNGEETSSEPNGEVSHEEG